MRGSTGATAWREQFLPPGLLSAPHSDRLRLVYLLYCVDALRYVRALTNAYLFIRASPRSRLWALTAARGNEMLVQHVARRRL